MNKITIERNQMSDWCKLLLEYPYPVWSGDVTSNLAVEALRDQGLCKEGEFGWYLTKVAIDSIRVDQVYQSMIVNTV